MSEQVNFSPLTEMLRLHGIGAITTLPEGWYVVQSDVSVAKLLSPLGDVIVDEIIGYEPRRAHFNSEFGVGGWAVRLVSRKDGGVYESIVDVVAPRTERSVRGVRTLANGAILHSVK